MKQVKVFLKTFGCQMNARDSEFVTGLLLENGFGKAPSIDKADVIIFNSCSVRKHAEDRLFSNIAELKHLKRKKPHLLIGLMGCTAQSYKDKALERAPLVDFVCGPGDEAALPRIIEDILEHRCPIIATGRVNDKRPEIFPKYRESAFKAYVSIGEGCNNYCSYCIVPYVRGRERSRNILDIAREVKDLAGRGFKEITLLGQNVNSYGRDLRLKTGDDRPLFVKLLEELSKINGIERMRFMTSHPKDASAEVFKAMRDLGKVCEHLHLPLQSGSDRILKLMNRGYTRSKYLKLADDYRKILPRGAITTDIVVGFPSESDGDFKRTIDIMKRIRFDGAFTFKYSARPPAKASRLKDDVRKETKDRRLEDLNAFQVKVSEEKNRMLVGRTLDVLTDGWSDKKPVMMNGRTRTNKVVVFRGDKKTLGTIINIKIESATPYALKGRIA